VKLFSGEHYRRLTGPDPRAPYRPEVLSGEHGAGSLGGIFGLLPPGTGVPYHYHERRESILIAVSGEAVEIVEGEETPVRAGDVLFIPAGERHRLVNRSAGEFRYLEFFTCPPVGADFLPAEEE
jgi:quercetin dioxygenase-like cupin family protein